MQFFYSASTSGLFRSDIHADGMPADCVPISPELHAMLIAGTAQGLRIVTGSEGGPALSGIRPSPDHKWTDSGWAIDLNQSHQGAVQSINRACEAAITAGFQSDALGAPHHYTSQLDDQLNLSGAIMRGLDMPYACRDAQGVKAFRLHTAAQLRQVGDDFTLYKLQLLQHANELKQQLDLALEAGDAEVMAQIRWEAVQP